jgi:hypothetical protein
MCVRVDVEQQIADSRRQTNTAVLEGPHLQLVLCGGGGQQLWVGDIFPVHVALSDPAVGVMEKALNVPVLELVLECC